MAKFSKTWWGERFLEALEQFTDPARLGRGRSYARGDRVRELRLTKGKISAKVRGKINPYFGVYKEPTYKTSIIVKPISENKWAGLIQAISSSASTLSRLLMNEMPDNIERIFEKQRLNLLPGGERDLDTNCSCPDWANPCKHIAGVYYLVAAELDRDPFLMFELRGLSKDELQKELEKSPLGRALASELKEKDVTIEKSLSYYARPDDAELSAPIDVKTFWHGKKRLPKSIDAVQETTVQAKQIKKLGDYPAFWESDVSFVETMEELYPRIRNKNRKLL